MKFQMQEMSIVTGDDVSFFFDHHLIWKYLNDFPAKRNLFANHVEDSRATRNAENQIATLLLNTNSFDNSETLACLCQLLPHISFEVFGSFIFKANSHCSLCHLFWSIWVQVLPTSKRNSVILGLMRTTLGL
jgi:hypothetical protein